MKIKNIILEVLGISALALLITGCGNSNNQNSSSSSSNKVLRLSQDAEISTLDNAKAADGASLTQLYHTGEGIYRLGNNSKIENALATKTTVAKDGLTYTFKLRKDEWSNGKPVTAKDFVYGWQRVVNPKTAAGYAYLFEGIKNFDAIQKGQMSPSQLGVYALNNNTLQVKLSKPVPYFKLLLAFPTFFPEEKSAVVQYGSRYGTTSDMTVSNGPFISSGWNGSNDTWDLKKNPKYWDAKNVHLNKINFQVVKNPSTGINLFQSGKLDEVALTGTQVANFKNNKGFRKYVGGSTIYMEMNQKHNKLLKNANIRKALSLMINKQDIANKVLKDGSTAPEGFVSTNLFQNPKTKADFAKDAYVKSGVAYNPSQATQLWSKGLKQLGESSSKKVSFVLLSDDETQVKSVTQYIQNQLEKLPNVTVSLTNIPKKNFLERQKVGAFDLTVSNWGADFADPINFLALMTKGNSNNNGGYTNSKYDQLIDKSNNQDANNPDKRYNDMVAAEKLLMNDQGVIPLYQPATAELWNPNVRGFVWNPAGMSNGYKNIYFAK